MIFQPHFSNEPTQRHDGLHYNYCRCLSCLSNKLTEFSLTGKTEGDGSDKKAKIGDEDEEEEGDEVKTLVRVAQTDEEEEGMVAGREEEGDICPSDEEPATPSPGPR